MQLPTVREAIDVWPQRLQAYIDTEAIILNDFFNEMSIHFVFSVVEKFASFDWLCPETQQFRNNTNLNQSWKFFVSI